MVILGALNMRHFMLLGFRFELKMFKFGYAASFGMSKKKTEQNAMCLCDLRKKSLKTFKKL